MYANKIYNLKWSRFLERSKLPRLDHKEIENLNRIATSKNIKSVIKNFPTKKSPVPVAFPGEFCYTLKDLIPILFSLSENWRGHNTSKVINPHPQTDNWPAAPEENHVLGWQPDSFFMEHFLGTSEIIVLIVLTYDCSVAICKLLHYTTIMWQGLCQLLVVVAWTGGILHATVQILFTMDLTFCGSNLIDHFMCNFFSLLKLSCSHTYMLGIMVAANTAKNACSYFCCSSSFT